MSVGCAGEVACGSALFVAVLDQLRKVTSRATLRRLLGLKEEKWPMDAWVDQHREDAIEPEMEIIDAHHHLWDPRSQPKGWPQSEREIHFMYGTLGPAGVTKTVDDFHKQNNLQRVLDCFGKRQLPFIQPYMGEELLLDIRNRDCGKRGHNIVKTVYLECGWQPPNVLEVLQPLGEAHMVAEVHAKHPSICNGTVAFANLLLPDVETTLEGLKKIPGVKGIRHSLAWSPDSGILGAGDKTAPAANTASDPQFRKGFALLRKYDLSYDCWMFHEQLGELTKLAKDFPDQIIICDHVAEPLGISSYKREATFPIWEKGIRELAAASPKVYCKLSGLPMCRTGFGFDDRPQPPNSDELAAAYAPYFNVCLEAFGVNRCLFASNFPVDKISCDYTVLFNAYKKIVKGHPDAVKRALFHDNAKRLYRL